MTPLNPSASSRPTHRRAAPIVAVGLGGAAGALARGAIGAAMPHASGTLAWATFVVNVVGAFALGALLEALTRLGPDEGARRRVRLVVGTGFCGAFTTYSAFARDIADLPHAGSGVAWALAQVLAGLVAATAGAAMGALLTRRGADAPGGPS